MNRRFIVAVLVGITAIVIASIIQPKENKRSIYTTEKNKEFVEIGYIKDDKIFINSKYLEYAE